MSQLRDRFEMFFAEVWGAEDEKAIANWMLSDVEAEGILPKRVVGPKEFANFHRAILTPFTEIHLEIEHSIETVDWLALYGQIHMTARASGKKVAMPTQMMMKFVDGRLAIGRNALDFMSLFEDTGALPPEALWHLLGGGTLRKM